MGNVLDGTDLILSVGGKALGYSTGCKITTSTETGERVTKEASAGKWKEKYVKSFSESISADGVVLTGSNAEMPTYDQLKDLQLAGTPPREPILFEKVMAVKARLPDSTRVDTSLPRSISMRRLVRMRSTVYSLRIVVRLKKSAQACRGQQPND